VSEELTARPPARSYQDLIVWQKGIDLVEAIYKQTAQWPSTETFGLTSQVRRAAVSIPANVAEGQGRGNTQDFVRFLTIARGSLRETETHLVIASRLQFLNDQDFQQLRVLTEEVGRLLHGLTRRVQANLEEKGKP
jgi:four helix bundle protein